MPTNVLEILRPRSSAVVEDNRVMTQTWYGWFFQLYTLLNKTVAVGQSVTITTAKLTTTGTNGSMTFVNGVLTAQTPAT